MYRVDRNDFYKEQKNATVFTPTQVSEFIFDIVHPNINKKKVVFDPSVGKGSLLKPFEKAGFKVFGVDVVSDRGFKPSLKKNFLELKKSEVPSPGLVIMNPPFNIDQKTKDYIRENYSGRPLLPEVWLSKTIELFGKAVPIVLFAPYGLRLNQTLTSKRWLKFTRGEYPEISSIISLPKDCFEDVLFHSEILIFNVQGLKGHYFYNQDKIQNAEII